MSRQRNRQIWAGLLISMVSVSAAASNIVYTPMNPAFGGSPLNGPHLLNEAKEQNKHKDPDAEASAGSRSGSKTPLQQFQESLQRSILNRVTQAVTSQVIDGDGNLIPGTIETTDFTIVITDNLDGTLTIVTTDKATGDSTSFTVSENF